jgi:hypothetical protein
VHDEGSKLAIDIPSPHRRPIGQFGRMLLI